MPHRIAFASVLLLTTVLAGTAYAVDKAAAPATEPPADKAAVQDAGKLSQDGAAAFRDLHMTRIAIFDADPNQAKAMISKAQGELAKAQTDETIFTKAESELKQPPTTGKMAATTPAASGADASKPIAWLPIDGQLTLGDDFVATPQKAAAVTEANKSLAKGDKQEAMQKLKLADVNVSFTMAVVPLAKTTGDVDQAASLIKDGKYYEANAVLKQAEDGMRFDMIDVDATPKPQKSAAAPAAPDATGAAATTKPAK